jgi:hypothetical protein
MGRQAPKLQTTALQVSARAVQTLAGDVTLTTDQILAANIMTFDNGDVTRTITLPTMVVGTMLFVSNIGSVNNVVMHDGAAAVITITPGLGGVVWVDYAGNWYGILSA